MANLNTRGILAAAFVLVCLAVAIVWSLSGDPIVVATTIAMFVIGVYIGVSYCVVMLNKDADDE